MNLTTSEIVTWLGGYFWPFVRIGAMLLAMPVFGTQFLPQRVRLHLALALSALVAPLVPEIPAVDPLSPAALMITFQQLAIGALMGLVFQMVFAGFVIGSQTMAMQIGLGFASMVDPVSGGQTPVLGMIYTLMVSVLFLTMNGHLVLIELLTESFRQMPIGPQGLTREILWGLVTWSGQMFVTALKVAMPILAALLVINLSFGVMTRAAPQFNIFAVGMPIFITGGLVVMTITLPLVVSLFTEALTTAFLLLRTLLFGGV